MVSPAEGVELEVGDGTIRLVRGAEAKTLDVPGAPASAKRRRGRLEIWIPGS